MIEYSVSQVAGLAGVSRQYIHQLINEGKIPTRRVGNFYVIQESDVEHLIKKESQDGEIQGEGYSEGDRNCAE